MKCTRVLYTVEIQIIKYINDMGRIVYCIILQHLSKTFLLNIKLTVMANQ